MLVKKATPEGVSAIICGFAAMIVAAAFLDGCGAPRTELERNWNPGQSPAAEHTTQYKIYDEWPFDATEARRRQEETAKALNVPIEKAMDLGDGVKLDLVLIPAGAFVMGSPANETGRFRDEVQHRVRITKPFYLGKYEVTQQVWQKVMGKNPSWYRGPGLPVDSVCLYDCDDFTSSLSELVKGKQEFRLPTEAEWEYACRAGSAGRFCFGDDEKMLGDYAWYRANSGDKTHQVGSKTPNAWGLCDMHGNVSEWCQDRYGRYHTGVVDDPTKPRISTKERVMRGGTCLEKEPDWQRCALRSSYAGVQRLGGVSGCRVVLPVALPENCARSDKRP